MTDGISSDEEDGNFFICLAYALWLVVRGLQFTLRGSGKGRSEGDSKGAREFLGYSWPRIMYFFCTKKEVFRFCHYSHP